MIRIARRARPLAAALLLLLGLVRPLASSQEGTCTRTHLPGGEVVRVHDAEAAHDAAAHSSDARPEAITGEHHHSSAADPDAHGAPSAPCGAAVVPAGPGPAPCSVVARGLVAPSDRAAADALVRPPFRPPRLS